MNRKTTIATVGILAACLTLVAARVATQDGMISPGTTQADARKLLEAGNKRFVGGGMESHSWQQEQVVKTGAEGQIPSIGVLSCADSRVPVEIIFDMGVGDLFVNRVAGNFESQESSGTFEYGVHALGVHTIVVLGHTKCGAVSATLAGKPLPGNMGMLTAAIRPGLEQLIKEKGAKSEAALLDAAVEANVRFQMRQVDATSELLKKAHAEGKIQVLGAIYDVDTGKVRFLD
jgi:carbonic anhydrase